MTRRAFDCSVEKRTANIFETVDFLNRDNYKVKEYPKEKDAWTQLAELFGESEDDDLSLLAKMRLALKWRVKRGEWKALSRIEQDVLFVSQSQGVQARIPFVLVDE